MFFCRAIDTVLRRCRQAGLRVEKQEAFTDYEIQSIIKAVEALEESSAKHTYRKFLCLALTFGPRASEHHELKIQHFERTRDLDVSVLL